MLVSFAKNIRGTWHPQPYRCTATCSVHHRWDIDRLNALHLRSLSSCLHFLDPWHLSLHPQTRQRLDMDAEA